MSSHRLGMVRCINPKHDDTNPSMALYENEDMGRTWHTCYCFACHFSSVLKPWDVQKIMEGIHTAQRITLPMSGQGVVKVNPKDYRSYEDKSYPISCSEPGFLEVDFWLDICSFFNERNITDSVVDYCKVRAVPSSRGLLFTHRTDIITGAQLRFIDSDKKPKILNLNVDEVVRRDLLSVQENLYVEARLSTVVETHTNRSVLVVTESYCDALAVFSHLWKDGKLSNVCITSPLSTTVNNHVIGAIHSLATQVHAKKIVFVYDNDMAGKDAVTKLTSALKRLGHSCINAIGHVMLTSKSSEKITAPYHTEYLQHVSKTLEDLGI